LPDRGEKARSRTRLIVFVSLLGVIASALVYQLARLTIVLPAREGGPPLTLPQVQRGSILDRNGRILAITTRVQSVSVWTPSISNAQETASLLAQTLGMEQGAVADSIRAHDGYAVIKRRISAAEAAAVAALQAQGKLGGVTVENSLGRLYPQGRAASQVVGWVGADNVPLGGIEYSLTDELAPQPVGTDTGAVYGDQVFLTIDLDVQAVVDRVAHAAMEANKPDSLTILVMDAPTGEFLAWTSLPDFDPNQLSRGTPSYDPASTSDRPLTLAYEPGSVFKIFSLSGLLDMGAIKPTDTFDTTGGYLRMSGSEPIRISDVGVHGVLTPQQIIQYSSNVGAAYASDRANDADFYRVIARFGFGKQTGVPLPGETAGILSDVSRWSGRTKTTMVFGQEISVSAVQVMQAATAIANGGLLLKPLIVKKIVSPQGTVLKEYAREPLWEVISPDSARSMLDWMETATFDPGGTARRAAVAGVRISAKTGTAQVTDPATGRYSPTDFVSSLIGIFPTEQPRYIVYVVLFNPKGQSYYGSVIAAPVFHDIAEGLLDLAGIQRAGTLPGAAPAAVTAPTLHPVQVGSPMPDLTGMPKKLLLPLLLRRDISVTINGSGFVATQDPAPGTRVEQGMRIVLGLK
jgi:cell division protein FtsI (penicillin-binding protein 3)